MITCPLVRENCGLMFIDDSFRPDNGVLGNNPFHLISTRGRVPKFREAGQNPVGSRRDAAPQIVISPDGTF
jgi:hypothetical protein